MDNLSLLYENKIHGTSLVRENILNEFRYYTNQNNTKRINELIEYLTPAEIAVLNQEAAPAPTRAPNVHPSRLVPLNNQQSVGPAVKAPIISKSANNQQSSSSIQQQIQQLTTLSNQMSKLIQNMNHTLMNQSGTNSTDSVY